MAADIWAIISKDSVSNWLLLHVSQFGTSWRHDVWQWWRRRRQNGSRRRGFLLDAISCINWSWRPPSSYSPPWRPILAVKHTTIRQQTTQQISIVNSLTTNVVGAWTKNSHPRGFVRRNSMEIPSWPTKYNPQTSPSWWAVSPFQQHGFNGYAHSNARAMWTRGRARVMMRGFNWNDKLTAY